mmetsp:Transcript_48/g.105  ORF Transcript_48/g.105 Transcript_48/m.105 type:complete len:343 (+) Transcript_48:57-1085(+)|eukprot:CAMPEP_0194076904 /NCGR_PEP_ID=MMETSP0149-20130528/3638_1 /TAXON_ID=122233 /ORGANISM="Chaetoceros debilis, Strain MM31A-1" /LENGTH=342 /DNA_ID=CAMNT_0038757785 /DNA_START=35 /DNA_END=1063 /DNA_ORIENTATION=-
MNFFTAASLIAVSALSGSEAFSISSRTVQTASIAPSRTSLNSASLYPEDTVTFQEEIKTPQEIEESTSAKSYLDDGFVFGLEGSGLERPRGKVAQVVVEGDTLASEPWQQALVASTLASHLAFCATAISHLNAMNSGNAFLTGAEAIATILSSWVIADFGSGVLHWSVDNYGNGNTPVMGGIIAAFQGHHSAPWTITEREFCNNVSKLCIPFGIPTVAAITLLAGSQHPLVSLFFAIFCALEIGSQEFHKWSHMTPKQLNPLILGVQKLGLTIGRIPHAMHHIAPYDGNYCIVSGFCNEKLDSSGFFRKLERVVYSLNGIEANAWKIDPKLKEKTLAGDYSP